MKIYIIRFFYLYYNFIIYLILITKNTKLFYLYNNLTRKTITKLFSFCFCFLKKNKNKLFIITNNNKIK